MKEIVKVLRPTLLTGIILLLVLLAQTIFFSSTTYSTTATGVRSSTSRPVTTADSNSPTASPVTRPGSDIILNKTCSFYGMGAPIRVTHNGATTVDIHWVALSVNLGLCYVFASLLSLMLTAATQFRRPGLVYGGVAVAVVATAFCVAIGISKSYWGYFLCASHRPERNQRGNSGLCGDSGQDGVGRGRRP